MNPKSKSKKMVANEKIFTTVSDTTVTGVKENSNSESVLELLFTLQSPKSNITFVQLWGEISVKITLLPFIKKAGITFLFGHSHVIWVLKYLGTQFSFGYLNYIWVPSFHLGTKILLGTQSFGYPNSI